MAAPTRYDAGARAFHWLSFVAIAVSFAIAWRMEGLGFSPMRLKMFNWHKWAGVTVLLLTVVRIAWRLTHAAPAPVPMPRLQALLAKGAHLALYPLILAQVATGWVHSNALGYPIVWFGKIPLPTLVGKDKTLAEQAGGLHDLVGWLLLAVIVAHVLAALKHHFIDKDDTLRRMMPH